MLLSACRRLKFPRIRTFSSATSSEGTKHGELFAELGISDNVEHGVFMGGKWHKGEGGVTTSVNPSTGQTLGSVKCASESQTQQAILEARKAFDYWRRMPAPTRGEIVRKIGLALAEKKDALATLVSLEVGKVKAEALQDVDSAIHMTGYTLGLSRSMSGKILPSETPHQLLLENYHPLGVVGSITSFNSTFSSFALDGAIGWTCGNALVWKPAVSANLTAIALTKIVAEALQDTNISPKLAGIMTLVCGDGKVGEVIAKNRTIDLVSFTGSTQIGKQVGMWVAERFGKVVLELAGNNAVVVMDDANLALALRSVVFSATASTAQRCTTTRRLFVQQGIYDVFFEHLVHAYKQLPIGDPLDPNTLIGPLHKQSSVQAFSDTLKEVERVGGDIVFGGQVLNQNGGYFVRPAIVRIDPTHPLVQRETFAPILFTSRFKELKQAIKWNNMVPQGLTSAIFSQDVGSMFKFTSSSGSDCGVSNVNVPPTGVEFGFGVGEKESGAGRAGGSDSWRNYMRRSSSTIYFGRALPDSHGLTFHEQGYHGDSVYEGGNLAGLAGDAGVRLREESLTAGEPPIYPRQE